MNVHAGGDAATFERALNETVAPLRRRLGASGTFALAVRFSARGLAELSAAPGLLESWVARARTEDWLPTTGNAFVHGEFHGRPLKDEVYRPPWGDARRTAYTLDFARFLAAFHEPGGRATLSTAPGAWKAWGAAAGDADERAEALVEVADGLARLEDETGVSIALGLEPEPGCTIETLDEAIAFWHGPWRRAAGKAGGVRDRHVGVCYDVCHQAVQHEDVAGGLARLREEGLPIVKVQLSAALEVSQPADLQQARALARFDEPVYLHQVATRRENGSLCFAADLGEALADPHWPRDRPWRVHFHVPLFADVLATEGLRTTRPDLEAALAWIAADGAVEQLEIETYTFDVLPADVRDAATRHGGLVDMLDRELSYVRDALFQRGLRAAEAHPS